MNSKPKDGEVQKHYDRHKALLKLEIERIRARLILTMVNTVGVMVLVFMLVVADVDATILERVFWMSLGWIAANFVRR